MKADLVYTVQASDEREGLLGIAQRLYGNANHWIAIYEASKAMVGHNPNVIRAGQQLIVPNLASDASSSPRVYVVQTADLATGLPQIARKVWNDPDRWPLLYAINHGVIGDDPRQIQAGQCLLIPMEHEQGIHP